MFQSPQKSIQKSKRFNSRRQLSAEIFSVQLNSDEERDVTTPGFNGKNQSNNEQFRKSDLAQPLGKFSEQYLRSYPSGTRDRKETYLKGKERVLYSDANSCSQQKLAFSTPRKFEPSINQVDSQNATLRMDGQKDAILKVDEQRGATLRVDKPKGDFLYINSSFTSYSSPLSPQQIECLSLNNQQTIKFHIAKARKQTDRLKDQNMKLRLEKVKATAQNSKKDTFKLIPLKIEHQKLKKQIQALVQEKQLLQLNKKMEEGNKSRIQEELRINGMEFQVLKNIPGSNYTQEELCLQIQNEEEKYKKSSKNNNFSPNYHNQYPFVSTSNASYSVSTSSVTNHTSSQLVKNPTTTSPPVTNTPDTAPPSIRKFISSNSQSIKSFFKLSMSSNDSIQIKNTDNFKNEHEKTQELKNENNRNYNISNDNQTSKSSFLKLTRQSLQNGAVNPTFYNYQNDEKFVKKQIS